MGKLIMHSMYPGKQVSDLQESDKQIISALSTLAAGLAGGVTGGGGASALAGAQAGKNAVENNALSDGFQLPKGITDYRMAVRSWGQYVQDNNISQEQNQAGLDNWQKVIYRKVPIFRK
ncbi:VENN motif pre-toxin domain-containing protein [Pantoea sp. B270]|uniref:VENN motif pre-toxin domain-containing protein n=1 Tax=Pantoea sp. B270 TaxID=2836826 RepID=UPI0020B3E82A|nr:VENN motif pre-toxin domain-containing protein [Pantoea sp. B270]